MGVKVHYNSDAKKAAYNIVDLSNKAMVFPLTNGNCTDCDAGGSGLLPTRIDVILSISGWCTGCYPDRGNSKKYLNISDKSGTYQLNQLADVCIYKYSRTGSFGTRSIYTTDDCTGSPIVITYTYFEVTIFWNGAWEINAFLQESEGLGNKAYYLHQFYSPNSGCLNRTITGMTSGGICRFSHSVLNTSCTTTITAVS